MIGEPQPIINSTNFPFKLKKREKNREVKSVYSRSLITITLSVPINAINKSLTQTLENIIKYMVEEKCIVEGYVKKNSVKIISFSSGLIKGDKIIFEVIYECEVCFPVNGMLLNCNVKNITKAGIRAESSSENPSPFVLFVARDHFYSEEKFLNLKENDKFIARVIGQRFELNDKYISIIAEVVEKKI